MKLRDAVRTLRFKNEPIKFNQLYTRWGEKLDPEHVLGEYPRPQLKRDNYTILNGYWNYNISKGSVKPEHYDGKILVPFSPESALSGVDRKLQPDETLWYERPLIIDQKPMGKRCILHFGAVDQICEVLINLKTVTRHVGGYLPFSVDITDNILEGGNLLTVKVSDLSDTSYHSRGKQKLKRGGMFYTAQSGIWQTVWMEWTPSLYITSLKITPLVDESSVHLEIGMSRQVPKTAGQREMKQGNKKGIPVAYRVDIYENSQRIHSFTGRNPSMTIPVKKAKYWSPENPHLYGMVIYAGEDRVESYFAMRKLEIRQDSDGVPKIFLNHEPYFQNGLLDQGYWPDGLYTAPSDEALIYDIVQAKALGFNMLRKHIKIEPLRWYYHCDRLGMLVWQDMVNGGGKYNSLLVGYLPTLFPCIVSQIKDSHYRLFARSNKEGRKEWLTECEETVRHLYNHPCIAVWVPFNEAWGQFDAIKAAELIRSLDGTRLIDHASGWYDQKGADFKSVHNYFHPLKVIREERPFVLSEYGGYACYIPGHSFSPSVYGYRIYLTKEDLEEALGRLFREEISKLKEKGLSAAVYTQLSDVEDEVNGLFTYDRKICKVSAPFYEEL